MEGCGFETAWSYTAPFGSNARRGSSISCLKVRSTSTRGYQSGIIKFMSNASSNPEGQTDFSEWQVYDELPTSSLKAGDVLRIETAEGIRELIISPDDQRKDPGIPVYQPGQPPYEFTNEIIGSTSIREEGEDKPGTLRVGMDVLLRFYSDQMPEGQLGIVQNLQKIEVKKATS